ncbi:MAG TPA: DUF1028 domain-containing protein [Anaerolineales bacterium]|nr:DUF1028 domain-containing protein [Anaerolineales bacterium]
MLHPSTFSIVACDLKAQAWGIAVASKFPAVGAVVPWAHANAGAVATQSHANTSFGPRGLEMMAGGLSAPETLSRLLMHDHEREERQVGLVDAKGGSAAFTGKFCAQWAGGVHGPGYSIQGNILTGAEVVNRMEHAFLDARGELPERLFAALEAGHRAGGDRRGKQSAALYVVKPKGGYGGYNDRWMDYRVDDHLNPITRLGELLELHHLYFDRSPRPERVKLEGKIVKEIQKIMKALGYYTPTSGQYDDATRQAFHVFIGNENFEARADARAGWIDGPVLEYLLNKFK